MQSTWQISGLTRVKYILAFNKRFLVTLSGGFEWGFLILGRWFFEGAFCACFSCRKLAFARKASPPPSLDRILLPTWLVQLLEHHFRIGLRSIPAPSRQNPDSCICCPFSSLGACVHNSHSSNRNREDFSRRNLCFLHGVSGDACVQSSHFSPHSDFLSFFQALSVQTLCISHGL